MGGRIFRAGIAALAALVLTLAGAAPAAAHNSLVGSDPKNGARLAKPPAAVRLTFLSRLSPKTKVTITGPDGTSVAAGPPQFAGAKVTVRLRPGRAGSYTVRYEVPSADGHPVRGKVAFTATAGNAPVATASPSGVDPSPTASTPPPTPSPAAGTPSEPDGGGLPASLFVALVVGLAAVGGLLWWARSRRQRGA
jgi:copper resistance protein C